MRHFAIIRHTFKALRKLVQLLIVEAEAMLRLRFNLHPRFLNVVLRRLFR